MCTKFERPNGVIFICLLNIHVSDHFSTNSVHYSVHDIRGWVQRSCSSVAASPMFWIGWHPGNLLGLFEASHPFSSPHFLPAPVIFPATLGVGESTRAVAVWSW